MGFNRLLLVAFAFTVVGIGEICRAIDSSAIAQPFSYWKSDRYSRTGQLILGQMNPAGTIPGAIAIQEFIF